MSFEENHALHGAALGVALYSTGIVKTMETAVLIGGAAAIYMMHFGHRLPSLTDFLPEKGFP